MLYPKVEEQSNKNYHVSCLLNFVCYSKNSGKYFVMHLLGMNDGNVVAEEPNPAVQTDVLTEILHLKEEKMSIEDVISRLRSRTVPPGYTYHTWKVLSGKLHF